jgi:hypothetical protein
MTPLQASDPIRVGDYWLAGRLGAGGMGQVYLARAADGTAVAVKVIRPDLVATPGFRGRFEREVASARRADGPYTAKVIAADPTGSPAWLATAYIAAPSLADAVGAHGPLPVAAVKALLGGLAVALGALHGTGLVHRDLKPGNVLLTADGPRIIDFGVSLAADMSTLTHTGQLLGSPGFMSPEQAEDDRRVGPASDMFALGALLCYAVTGEGPFGAGQTPALVYRIVHEQPRLDAVPDELREVLARCLAKDPARRPTPGEILTALAVDADAVAARFDDWLPERVAADARSRLAASQRMLAAVRTAPATVDPALLAETALGSRHVAAAPSRRRRRVLALGVGATALVLAAAATAGYAAMPDHPARSAGSVPDRSPAVATTAPTAAVTRPAAVAPGPSEPASMATTPPVADNTTVDPAPPLETPAAAGQSTVDPAPSAAATPRPVKTATKPPAPAYRSGSSLRPIGASYATFGFEASGTTLSIGSPLDYGHLWGAYLPGSGCSVTASFDIRVSAPSGSSPGYGWAVAPLATISGDQPSGWSLQHEWDGATEGFFTRPVLLPDGAWAAGGSRSAPDVRSRHHVTVAASGDTYQVSIDGTSRGSFSGTAGCGVFAIRVWGGATAHLDHLIVKH